MKSTEGRQTRRVDPNWLAMEERLLVIERTLVDVQTVINLLLDLLERTLPAGDARMRNQGVCDEV